MGVTTVTHGQSVSRSISHGGGRQEREGCEGQATTRVAGSPEADLPDHRRK